MDGCVEMGVAKSLMAIAHKADVDMQPKPTITMPAWALNVLAHEIEADLEVPLPGLFLIPWKGFKFMGIAFEPNG